MIWFSADWHLGHSGIISHQKREFDNTEQMDAAIIDCANAYMRPNDELFFLGDFCWKPSQAGHYRQRLNVRKLHVCQGNHDANSLQNYVSTLQDMIYRKFKFGNKTYKFHLCHYPLMSWRGLHRGAIHLYGHSHGAYEKRIDLIFPNRRAMDVGVDVMAHLTGEWRPVSLPEILCRLVGDGLPWFDKPARVSGPFETVGG